MVDVMLVLLIIFIITVPVLKHAVNIELPAASNVREVDKPETVQLTVDAQGSYFWNGELMSDAVLATRLEQLAQSLPQPAVHIRGDKDVRYERVAQALALAQRAGVRRLGFVTEPARP
ncbi:MAG: biopolymer transporter ExbD, partial [Lysobacteraceae bacterium]